METTTYAPPVASNPTTIPSRKPDAYLITGYVLLALSFIIFLIADTSSFITRSDLFAIFSLNYVLAIAYVIVLLFNKAYGIRRSWRDQHIHKTVVLLNLFLVSAYTLNREIPVFENSAVWLCAYLLITSLNLISYHYYDILPQWINKIQQVILGGTFILYLYLTLYVADYYPFSIIGMLFFGIGTHIFVPLTLFIAAVFMARHHFRKKNISYGWMVGGFLFTLFFTAGFISEWNSRVKRIETLANQSVMYTDTELPVWVKVGQSLQNDWITRRILKSDLVYTTRKDKFNDLFDGWWFVPSRGLWDETREHDPLVFLSTFKRTCTLSAEDRVKILKAISDVRHNANERLWSADHLTTSYIVSDVDIYPELRLSYTEKYLNIRNSSKTGWSGNQEEAIYTFQLPEGAVVTSLSLWINGKEEKGILTSKQKAVNAYKTIVGVEARDPSVVHWQEGNTVTVRVFPCTREEERKFKIGVTAPLIEQEEELLYRNMTFRGPSANDADETTRVRFIGSKSEMKMPGFRKDRNGDYVLEGKYDPEFEVSLGTVPLKKDNAFSFQGYTYSVSKYNPVLRNVNLNSVYLDINNSWRNSELNDLKKLLDSKPLFVYHQENFVRLTADNWDVVHELQRDNFSVFPFHLLKDKDHALVITKGKPLSPHLSDFKDSDFAKRMSKLFAKGEKVYVYNLGTEVSTYVRSLREFRALQFAQGNTAQLIQLLSKNNYPLATESSEEVILYDANLVMAKKKTEGTALPNTAPDHVARLFAYNDILRKVGANYFEGDYVDEALVDEAATAYVVSPVSSLIVLETQKDYQRFDITDNEDSLKNASKQSSGAVPEPHEWALIALLLLFIAYIKLRDRKLKAA
jgi:XrtN system VIT domain protein